MPDRRIDGIATDQGERHPARPAGRIKDARGRLVTQLDPVALYLLRQHSVIDVDVLRAIAHEPGVQIARWERVSLLVGIIGALLVIGLFTYALVSGDIRDAPLAKSSGLVLLCATPFAVWYGTKRSRFAHVAAAMLKHLRCPHCGYDLRGLPADPSDDASVCPECGRAWRVSQVQAADSLGTGASGATAAGNADNVEERGNG